MDHLIEMGKIAAQIDPERAQKCKGWGRNNAKGVVHQDSFAKNAGLAEFQAETGLNLDRFGDIQKLIGVNMMTQSRNSNDPKQGDPDFAVTYFPSLFACNDAPFQKRYKAFVSVKSDNDEITLNARQRKEVRESIGLGSVPKNQAAKYGLEYDPNIDY